MAHIVVTRPQGKGDALASELRALGHEVTLTPVLEIDYFTPSEQELTQFNDAEMAVFVSQDAVISLKQNLDSLPANMTCFAVGQTTANALQDQFGKRAVTPEQFDSEGLLALAQLQSVEGKHLALVKGKGGRPLIAKTLKERGALVHLLNVYERSAVQSDSQQWLEQWQGEQVDAIVVTSCASAEAIFDTSQAEQLKWLSERQFYVVSERVKQQLIDFNVDAEHIHVATDATDAALLTAINEQEPTLHQDVVTNNEQQAHAQPEVETVMNNAEQQHVKHKQKTSKTAVLALLVALGAGAGVAYMYWQDLQASDADQQAYAQQITQLKNDNAALRASLTELQTRLSNVRQSSEQSVQGVQMEFSKSLDDYQRMVSMQIDQAVEQAKQDTTPPLDYNEVKRLVTLADFKIWSEHNYRGAQSVLERLDALLAGYAGNTNLRRAVAQDIQSLSAVQVADVQKLVLTLDGLSKQVDKLDFNMAQLPQAQEQQSAPKELSEDVSQWRTNLAQTWEQIVDDFIKVRRREGQVEPLLDSEQQRIIRARLHFYLEQAGFAATHRYTSLYEQSLTSASDLLARYFDLSQAQANQFLVQLKQLRLASITPEHDIELATLRAVEEK